MADQVHLERREFLWTIARPSHIGFTRISVSGHISFGQLRFAHCYVRISSRSTVSTWVWDETWNTNFPQGAWLTVTTTLSPQAALPVRELGLKFYLDDNYTGPIYIDAVTW